MAVLHRSTLPPFYTGRCIFLSRHIKKKKEEKKENDSSYVRVVTKIETETKSMLVFESHFVIISRKEIQVKFVSSYPSPEKEELGDSVVECLTRH